MNTKHDGVRASAPGIEVKTFWVDSLPIINDILGRSRLRDFLDDYLRKPSRAPTVPYPEMILTLVRNILLSREPMYGVGDWAKKYAPDLLELSSHQIHSLNDDRVGRCLDVIFHADYSSLLVAFMTHVVREFEVTVEELHNDSTPVTFTGKYEEASTPHKQGEKQTLAITRSHGKTRHPHLKQLLFILTTSRDEGLPLHFRAADGNASDSVTHVDSWEMLCQIAGRRDFLYVADAKLASTKNMKHIDSHGGRFVTVLPRTRRECGEFRKRVIESSVEWKKVHRRSRPGGGENEFRCCSDEITTEDGYQLLWFHSTAKEKADANVRKKAVKQTEQSLEDLRDKLASPKTRYREKNRIQQVVDRLLKRRSIRGLFCVEITSKEDPSRENSKRRRYDLDYEIDEEEVARQVRADGLFPLVTNDRSMSPQEVLLAHKRQPVIEKRFAQLKSGFEVSPVFLKTARRIEGLLCTYFFAMLIQVLVQREARQRMRERAIESMPLYHEDRASKQPSSTLLFKALSGILRHTVRHSEGENEMVTELDRAQRQVVELYGFAPESYGRSS